MDGSLLASRHASAVHIHTNGVCQQTSQAKTKSSTLQPDRITGYYRRQFSSFV